MWFLRISGSILFLASVLISVPLAFDIGGRLCGLAFSLSLAKFYFGYSLLRLITPRNSRWRWLALRILSILQWGICPFLLIWTLNRFSVEEGNQSGWIERNITQRKSVENSSHEWFFGHDGVVESLTVGLWDKFLRWSTPAFQLVEGFCSLLVIQASGQIARWLVNRDGRSESWMIGLLVMSASIISGAVYFLWRLTHFPDVDSFDAILIGITITCAVFLCAWGIGSGKGNPVESSLLFAYVVLCLYQMFTDYQSSSPVSPNPVQSPQFPPLPPIVMASYTTITNLISILPGTIHAGFNFIAAALSTVTPSVIVSLAYRLFVLYASTRIIPAVRGSGSRALAQEASLDDTDGAGKVLGLLSWFSPSILITVYTSLLRQHFATTGLDGDGDWWTNQGGDSGSNSWKWINVSGTMALYALELYLSKDDLDGGPILHWKDE